MRERDSNTYSQSNDVEEDICGHNIKTYDVIVFTAKRHRMPLTPELGDTRVRLEPRYL